jgi:hypothetical protein
MSRYTQPALEVLAVVKLDKSRQRADWGGRGEVAIKRERLAQLDLVFAFSCSMR